MKRKITIGEKYEPAMRITEQADADRYFNECVEHTMLTMHCSLLKAREIERANLGYFAGYYDSETRARVEQLFKCAHPNFGAIKDKGVPTPEEAIAAGKKAGEQIAAMNKRFRSLYGESNN